jgi:hypothetical protein
MTTDPFTFILLMSQEMQGVYIVGVITLIAAVVAVIFVLALPSKSSKSSESPMNRTYPEDTLVQLISLPSDTIRRTTAIKRLNEIGARHVVVVQGVDGRTMGKDRYINRSGRLNKGQMGAAASHIRAWKRASSRDGGSFIFEDDVIFTTQLKQLDDLEIPQEADIVYLGCCYPSWSKGTNSTSSRHLEQCKLVPECLHGYWVSRDFSEFLVKRVHTKGVDLPIDTWVRQWKPVVYRVTNDVRSTHFGYGWARQERSAFGSHINVG